MKGDVRCVEGRLMRHDPQFDDPDLETDRGECPECQGKGCEVSAEVGPRPRRPLTCPGIGRDKDCINALQFYFNRPVSDYEMRFLHGVMKRAAACMPIEPDPRDPDPSRPGIFRDHNCYRCKDGAEACVTGGSTRCPYPHARND